MNWQKYTLSNIPSAFPSPPTSSFSGQPRGLIRSLPPGCGWGPRSAWCPFRRGSACPTTTNGWNSRLLVAFCRSEREGCPVFRCRCRLLRGRVPPRAAPSSLRPQGIVLPASPLSAWLTRLRSPDSPDRFCCPAAARSPLLICYR